MTTVTYNGVTLKNVLTRQFSQMPVRDRDSDTDVWYWEFTIRVLAIVNVDLLDDNDINIGTYIPGGSTSVDLSTHIANLRARLTHDRKEFVYYFGDDVVISSSSATDANNGPKVEALDIVQVAPKTLRIEFAVKVAKVECPDRSQSQGPPVVVCNRWSTTDDIDDKFRTVRTIRGRLRLGQAIKSPHAFRGMVIPVLQKGFRRARMSFAGEANALELGYEIVDEEMLGEAAPSPAVRMEGHHTESLNNGADNIGEMALRLEGHKGSDKRHMLQRCMQIIVARLQLANKDLNSILMNLVITDYIGDDRNAVEVRAQVRRAPDTSKGNGLGTVMMATLGKPLKTLKLPQYDPNSAVVLGVYGTATTAGLFAAFLQSPCDKEHGMTQEGGVPESKEGTKRGNKGGTEVTYTEGPLTPEPRESTPYSQEHLAAKYEFYQIDSTTIFNFHRAILPIAAQDPKDGKKVDSSVLITLASITPKRIIRIHGERVGAWPKIFLARDFTDRNGIKHWILKFTPTLSAPTKTPDGSNRVYALQAEYVYGMSRSVWDGEGLSITSLPWDQLKPAESSLRISAFSSAEEFK